MYITRDSQGLGKHVEYKEDHPTQENLFTSDARGVYCVGEVVSGSGMAFVGAVHQLGPKGADEDLILVSQTYPMAAGTSEKLVLPFVPMDAQGVPNENLPLSIGTYECEFRPAEWAKGERARFVVTAAQCPRARLSSGQSCFVGEGVRCARYGTPSSTAQCSCTSGAWQCGE